MARLTLHLAFHLHQPPGTVDTRVADAVTQCYEPLIALLEAHPEVDAALHVGGHLLEWLEIHERALGDRIAALVSAGEIEVIGGGFYAPVLALLLWRDAIGQLEMSAGYLERRTGVRPSGAWLFEQVWTPRMAEILSDAGVTWTMIHEGAIRSAGVEGDISGWYVTEHAARPVAVFPLDQDLRRRMEDCGADAIVDYLAARLAQHGDDLTLTWAGEVERLIATHEAGFGWLQALFERLALEQDWVQVVRPSQTLATQPAMGRVYLPDSVHPDLVELTLQPARVAAWRAQHSLGARTRRVDPVWQRSSVWQSFLARYGEADRLHKRMIEVSRRFAAVERVMRNGGFRAMSRLTRPRRMLYRGQAGPAYGHGHSAGVHDADLRAGVYRQLMGAEVACNALVGEGDEPGVEVGLRDLHADMTTCVLLRSPTLRVVMHPARGGAMVGLEHVPACAALHDVLTRRPEAYHGRGEQEVDGHERAMLHDRFLQPDAATAAWMNDAAELGDLLHRPYRLLGVDDAGRGASASATVHLAGDGVVRNASELTAVSVLKQITVAASAATVHTRWSIELAEPLAADCDFGVEYNVSGLGADPDAVALLGGDRPGAVRGLGLARAGLEVVFEGSGWRLDHAPIVTVARPVGGAAQRCFQGTAVLLRRRIPAGERTLTCEVTLRIVQSASATAEEAEAPSTALDAAMARGLVSGWVSDSRPDVRGDTGDVATVDAGAQRGPARGEGASSSSDPA